MAARTKGAKPMSTIALAITAVSTVCLAGAAAADTPAAELTNDPSGIAVVEFLDLALNQKQVDAAIDKYLAPPYTQHNPMVPDGIEGARVGLGGLVKQLPGSTTTSSAFSWTATS
jgi:uncharacterized iron-regulated protein